MVRTLLIFNDQAPSHSRMASGKATGVVRPSGELVADRASRFEVARSQVRVDADVAAALLNDAVTVASPGPYFAHSLVVEKRLENSLTLLSSMPVPRIADGQHHIATRPDPATMGALRLGQIDLGQFQW